LPTLPPRGGTERTSPPQTDTGSRDAGCFKQGADRTVRRIESLGGSPASSSGPCERASFASCGKAVERNGSWLTPARIPKGIRRFAVRMWLLLRLPAGLLFLSELCDVNAMDTNGWTALHCAGLGRRCQGAGSVGARRPVGGGPGWPDSSPCGGEVGP
jgi:hypothetical protein